MHRHPPQVSHCGSHHYCAKRCRHPPSMGKRRQCRAGGDPAAPYQGAGERRKPRHHGGQPAWELGAERC